MRLRKWLFFLLACSVLFSGCTASISGNAADYAPSAEQKLTIYTSHKEEVYQPIIREFEERTGIWVNVVTGGTNELLERIAGEQDAPVADVMFGGGVESLESYRDCFEPYVCTESHRIDQQFQNQDAYWTPFSALPVVLVYNTKLVAPEQLTCWADLGRPEFSGRVAFADPSISGSSFTALVTQICAAGQDSQTVLAFFAEILKGHQLDSSGAVLTSVANGTDLVGITLEETALKRIDAGDDIALVYPSDGTSCVPDGSALIKGAPHSDNAKLFLDFTVSYDVQQLLAGSFYRRPVRTDIQPEQVLSPLSAIALVDYDVSWAAQNRDAILSDWAFFRKEGS